MLIRALIFSLLSCALLACTAEQSASVGAVDGSGYQYHDANHPNSVAQASPQAQYNAAHGVWLWPPQDTTRPR